ncbi:glutamate receptor ionotropic, delta-1-like [Solenopsis invicta]|uniref:glutamate receptor ionotropic, delta-1-like n=1 Tax=Solenopsis invicta TaxID=13686 RepID=UPI00193DB2FF|nr:glutamate receptor ionotropic, delta-1-like [Solenopsis invicta]
MTPRLIAILFVLSSKPLTDGIDINNYFRLINDVHRYYRTSCIIFVRSSKYDAVFDMDITDLNMTTLVHTWSRKFSQQRVMTVTRTFLDLMNEYKGYQQTVTRPLFVVLLDIEETMSEFAMITKTIKPISFPFWLVMFLQYPGNPLEKYCRYPSNNIFNVDFGTQMLVLCYDCSNLVEWYAIHDNRTRTFDLATWSSDKGLILRTLENFYGRRSNMFGDVIRVASVSKWSPLVSHENSMLGGYLGMLLTELSKEMNFTVKLLDPEKAFGWFNEQRTGWTGVINQLIVNEADLGVSSFTLKHRRLNVVDFTLPLIRSTYRLYFKQPDIDDVNWSMYFMAFSFEVWISLIILIIIATIMLTIMQTKKFSINLIFENYIKVWGIYCQQSLPGFPKESPIRMAFLSIYVSSIITMAIYSASVISYLTTSTQKLVFSTLDEFVVDGSFKFLVLLNSAEYDLPSEEFTSNIVGRIQTSKQYYIINEIIGINLNKSVDVILMQICERQNVAFYTSKLNKESSQLNLQCTIGYVNSGRIEDIALILPKGSPYTRFINYHLRRFRFNGILSKLENEYIPRNVPLRQTIYKNVNLQAVTPILTIVISSMILALFILIIEKLHYLFKTRSKNNELFNQTFSHNLDIKNKLHELGFVSPKKRQSYLNNIFPDRSLEVHRSSCSFVMYHIPAFYSSRSLT